MNKELSNIQDLKSAFISHCKELGCDENYIKVCENKFSNIETTLKDYEKLEFTQNTINDFYPSTKSMIDDLLDLVCTKMCDFLKEGETYTKASLLETLGCAIRYVKTFAYGGEFNETEKMGVREKKLKALEIIKSADFSLEFDESQGEWFLYISDEEQSILVAKGAGVKIYDLLKEVLL